MEDTDVFDMEAALKYMDERSKKHREEMQVSHHQEHPVEHVVDRTGWPSGPWDNEPDYVQWQHAGYDCLIVRNQMGGLCGYVGVDSSHPYYGTDYNDIDYEKVNVHGGLTFAGKCHPPICHASESGISDVWWLGFDCAHAGDVVPQIIMLSPKRYSSDLFMDDTYKDIRYVTAEVESLADQLRDVAATKPH